MDKVDGLARLLLVYVIVTLVDGFRLKSTK